MFDDSSVTAGYFNANNAGTPSKAKAGNQNRLNNVLPVCIRQLLSVTGDEFSLFGTRPQILSIVGILRDYNVTSIKATYTIDDHTGSMKATLWLDTEISETVSTLPKVKEGNYVKVFGSLRTNDNEKSLLILKMFPVEDANVITTHLLEVIEARYSAEKQQSEGNYQKSVNNPAAQLANTMNHVYQDPNQSSSFTPIQSKVHGIFKKDNSTNGLNIAVLLTNFQKNQHDDVHKAIEFLQSEGHIYSTIDAQHFKSTD